MGKKGEKPVGFSFHGSKDQHCWLRCGCCRLAAAGALDRQGHQHDSTIHWEDVILILSIMGRFHMWFRNERTHTDPVTPLLWTAWWFAVAYVQFGSVVRLMSNSYLSLNWLGKGLTGRLSLGCVESAKGKGWKRPSWNTVVWLKNFWDTKTEGLLSQTPGTVQTCANRKSGIARRRMNTSLGWGKTVALLQEVQPKPKRNVKIKGALLLWCRCSTTYQLVQRCWVGFCSIPPSRG